VIAAAVALLAAAAPACAAGSRPVVVAPAADARAWPAPLDRAVALDGLDLPLREALERVAAAARLRLSYSPELLPAERRVCVAAARATAGDALVALLAGTGLAPVVAGGDQIVLAPARSAAAADAPPTLARSTGRLERVVVTGTATGAPERGSPYALAVVDRRTTAAREGTQSLAQAFDGAVPGVWLWTQAPTSVLARYGSVRGASSFGVSSPKVYVDGIEVANPLLLAQLDPARVQRIEVIRGPQGAALYGADAISGVVQIVTRHEGVGAGAPRAELRGSAGAAGSDYATGGVLAQDHGLQLRAGSSARSAALGVTGSTFGAFVPGAAARQLLAHGAARRVAARSVLTGTLRLQATDADAPASPLLADLAAPRPDTTVGATPVVDSLGRQSARQYTLGGTATLHASERWTHVAIAGVDGYRLAGVSAEGLPMASMADSALRAARGGADRASLRLSSTARVGDPAARALTVTVGAEHSTARERTNSAGTLLVARAGAPQAVGGTPRLPSGDTTTTTWWSTTGALAQAQAALGDAVFLTGGARVEHIRGPAGGQTALLPMLGGAWVVERGPLTAKARAAYGRGIRPARTVARGATWTGGRVAGALAQLEPEQQSGVELGVDLLWGRRFGVQVTRFDQRVSDLVQPVALLGDTARRPGGPLGPGPGGGMGQPRYAPRVVYALQNVGAIDNAGWEVQASAGAGPLALAATLSLVGSRVARLANGYTGDLRAGDRMLEVPARTLGLNASWTAARWSASASLAHAADWINYDRLSLAEALAESLAAGRPPVGAALRRYWIRYDGVTRVGARLSYALGGGATLLLGGDNLLDTQVGEPDNATVLPGRTVTLGVRAGF
jgi:iron complex outermembrane receptor protein